MNFYLRTCDKLSLNFTDLLSKSITLSSDLPTTFNTYIRTT